MKILLILVLSFFISIHSAIGLISEYEHITTIPNFEGKFTTDPLGNIYRFNQGDLTKYDLNGNETGLFSSRDYGDISYVDASNPMKVLVVFERFSKAMVLDAGLSANFMIDLSFPGSPIISLICMSAQDGYWIYDPNGMQIKKVNTQLAIISEGTGLRQVTSSTIEPKQIYDSGQWLVLNAPSFGILVFDQYGTYFKTLKVDSVGEIQIRDRDEVLFKDDQNMVSINIKTGATKKFSLPENQPEDQCRVESNRIYILSDKSLKIYSY